jgi:Protein NO VEIN, C-terminal
VIDYERGWLRQNGRPDLADCVRWTAREYGDGLGYDILSFDLAGHERYIEVKTTALGAETPFYITSAELDFAKRHADHCALYRVYDVLGEPRFFALEGDITHVLGLTSMSYSARIAATTPAISWLSEAADKLADGRLAVRAEK